MNARLNPSIRRRLISGAILLACILVPLRALAQGDVLDAQRQRVGDEIERTERVLEKVSERVLAHDAAEPRELLERARMVQMRAKHSMSGATDAGMGPRQMEIRLRAALSETRHARELATRAARRLQEILSETERAQRRLEEAQRWLTQAQEDSDRVDDLRLQQAMRLVEQAELRLREGHPRQALRLLQNARALVGARTGSGDLDEERLREGLARAEETLARLSDREDHPPQVQRAMERIEKLLAETRGALDAGRLGAARTRLAEVRRVLRQVEDRPAGPPGGEDRLVNALEQLSGQLDRIGERLPSDAPAATLRLYERARDERDAAADALAHDDTRRAGRHLRTAADLVARLQRRLPRTN